MGFSRTEPMFYLIDFRGVKAGTPVKLKANNHPRIRMLAAKGVVGTKVDLESEVATKARVEATKDEPVQEESKDEPVQEESKDEPAQEEQKVEVSLELQPKKGKSKKRR